MRVLLIGHAYTAAYNRIDKLSRIAQSPQIERLGVVIPSQWHDRMADISRDFTVASTDTQYDVFPLKTLFSGSQRSHLYLPHHLLSVIDHFRPDVIHIEQEPHDLVTSEIILLNQFSTRCPITVFTWENLARQLSFVHRCARWYVLKHAAVLINGNNAAVQLNQRLGFAGHSTVLPQFGVDVDRFKPMDVGDLRQQLDLNDQTVIGFAGRYVSEKGISTLVNAVTGLDRATLPPFSLLLISSMAPPSWLSDVADKLHGVIKFAPNVPHEDFPRYMNLCDVLVLPSESQPYWEEQFGRVMVEAMACGIPVIGSSSGAIPEIIHDQGWVFEEKNVNDLQQKLKNIISNPHLLQEKKQTVRQFVIENYSHEKIVAETVKIWQETL